MQQSYISHQSLLALLSKIVTGGTELYAPQKTGEKLGFARVLNVGDIAFDPGRTIESPKTLLFPNVERLLSFERTGDGIRVDDPSTAEVPERVLFGARPCDAAGLERLAQFFAAEIADAFVAKRHDHLTVISLACAEADASCFCTSVGIGPGETAGSDVLLVAVGDGRYAVECLTDRGSKLFSADSGFLEHGEQTDTSRFLASVEPIPGLDGFKDRLARSFDHPFWQEASLRCLGCGACAYVCPLCSCFDIEDEGSPSKGERLRCWDSCGFALFTLHTSGHNPRSTQSERWRQRVMHKFSYMPERFGFFGCVGCGRCSRACPADMNLKEQIVITATRIVEQVAQ